jgi:tetratricopeptide (TPR) repeat protein
MIFLAALLILAQLGAPPACKFEERPAPKASRAVQAMLRAENPTRATAERARHYAVMNGDPVGEAQGNFILARLAFERSGKWPSVYLQRAAAACARGGCGPQIIEGLFEWAAVVGPESPTFQQAIDLALSIAEHETLRPRAAVEQLVDAESALSAQPQPAAKAAALRSRRLAFKLLRHEADGEYGQSPARMASAANRLGELLSLDHDPEGAIRAYMSAASTWSGAGCRPESVGASMRWAALLDSSKSRRGQMNHVLARALATADVNTRPADTDSALTGYIQVWKDASAANQKSYLQLRRTLIKKIRPFDTQQAYDLAQDAEALSDWDLAYELYSQLLRSAHDTYFKKEYLEALARAADKLGKRKEAADYRQRAARISDIPDAAAADAPAAAAGGGGGPQGDQSTPWKPPQRPEQPGRDGGTRGERIIAPPN